MKSEQEQLHDGLKELGFEISSDQSTALIAYLEALDVTNQSFNLTRIPRSDFVSLHLLDSLTALLAIPSGKPLKIIDVGTGAGFPGVPLASLLPNAQVSLLDSTLKKVKFVEFTAHEAGITNCKGIHCRAEELAKMNQHRNGYDVVISRAVAAFPKLMEWLMPLAKVGGCVIAMKGSGYEQEVEGTDTLVKKLGGKIEELITARLPGTDIIRHLIIVRKERATPA
jgi:16S rRNA (guanine527-N7)-methyltransferase